MVLEKALTDAPLLSNDINYKVAQFKRLAWFNLNLVKEAATRDQEAALRAARTAVGFAALGIVCAAFAQVWCVAATTAGVVVSLKEAADALK